MELGLLEKDALIEKLAREFYRIQGYVVRGDYRMQDGTHPHEKACVEMAFTAIEEVEFALADLDEDEEEEENTGMGSREQGEKGKVLLPCSLPPAPLPFVTWQQGQPLYEEQQYYFCKYGNFVLTLVTNSQYSNFVHTLVSNSQLTRTEAYLGNQKIYFCEEEISPDEATRKLQEFLSTLANQLKNLSNITFEEESK